MGAKTYFGKAPFFILTAAVCISFLSSCMKKESYSDVPYITYAGYYNIFDTTKIAKRGVLTITFQDGDGDLGLNPWDVFPPYDSNSVYFYNYYIDIYSKRKGVFVKDTLQIPLRYRIPNLTPEDPNKAIKGIIVDTLPLNPKPVYDTIRFSLYIYDRALHQSNIVTTPEFVVRRP